MGFGGGDVHVPDVDSDGLVNDGFFHFDNFWKLKIKYDEFWNI